MNRTATGCRIWAAGLFVTGMLVMRFQDEIFDGFNRIFGPDTPEPIRWVMVLQSTYPSMAFATGGGLIAAAVVLQKLAPRPDAPASPPHPGVDAAA